jgi:serine/threonine protein phosphatase PrpC
MIRVECYGQSRPQDGRSTNEDAFLIAHAPVPLAAVCDGAGAAAQAAKRSLRVFEQMTRSAAANDFLRPEAWNRWLRQLDLGLLGGTESTFVGVAVVGNQLVGAAAGDSRAYFFGAEGNCETLSAGARKQRLGSGEVTPFFFQRPLSPRDIVLLMSDGAWSPLSPYLLQRAARGALGHHFSEVPAAVLRAGSKTGRCWDDMTVVALRLLSK